MDSNTAQLFNEAFGNSQSLLSSLPRALAIPQNRDNHTVLKELSEYTISIKSQRDDYKRRYEALLVQTGQPAEDVPPPKRRRLGEASIAEQTVGPLPTHSTSNGSSTNTVVRGQPLVDLPDISFSVPVRKKLTLSITTAGVSGASAGGNEFALTWDDIEHTAILTVPEKAQPSTNIVLIPRAGLAAPADTPLVFTVLTNASLDSKHRHAAEANLQAAGAKPSSPALSRLQNGGVSTILDLLQLLLTHTHKPPLTPSSQEFVSATPAPTKAREAQYHVKAHKGSKDGYLYFLAAGILFGFRKPVLFFPLHAVTSISYSAVLRLTFNLTIGVQRGEAAEDREEIEFSMLDQADFTAIDAYVKRHGLHDESLAARRRFDYNRSRNAGRGADGAEGTATAVDMDGALVEIPQEQETELARAERELQDAEDEEEEDYDPSGGESEGSGYGSEEEEDGEGEGDEEIEAEDDEDGADEDER